MKKPRVSPGFSTVIPKFYELFCGPPQAPVRVRWSRGFAPVCVHARTRVTTLPLRYVGISVKAGTAVRSSVEQPRSNASSPVIYGGPANLPGSFSLPFSRGGHLKVRSRNCPFVDVDGPYLDHPRKFIVPAIPNQSYDRSPFVSRAFTRGNYFYSGIPFLKN